MCPFNYLCATNQEIVLNYAPDAIKAKSILGNAVSETIFAKIVGCKTAKEIWDTLIVQYEGVTVVKSHKRKNLKNYDNFVRS